MFVPENTYENNMENVVYFKVINSGPNYLCVS